MVIVLRKRDKNLNIRLTENEMNLFITEWQKSKLSKVDFLMKLLKENNITKNIVMETEDNELPKEF